MEEAIAPTKKAKANTSKPRAKKVSTGRVEKKSAAKPKTTTTTAKSTGPRTKTVKKSLPKAAKDKVAGKVKKAEGTVEDKPAKKVRL